MDEVNATLQDLLGRFIVSLSTWEPVQQLLLQAHHQEQELHRLHEEW